MGQLHRTLGLLSPSDLGQILGLTRSNVQYYIEAGLIPAPTHNIGVLTRKYYTQSEADAIKKDFVKITRGK